MLSEQTIVFLGAGSMAEALLRGIVDAKLVPPQSIVALNRQDRSRLDALKRAYGIRVPETGSAEERRRLVREADIVVLAMKPQHVGSAMDDFLDALRPDQLLISVIAGLTIGTIEQLLDRAQPIVRTMPNTSSTIGLGATGVACSASVSANQREMALKLLGAIGIAVPMEEDHINLVTGVSGSGPAYVYYFMEALIEAAVEDGLPPEDARALVAQTVLGAARMVETTREDPAALRAKVTSPNGTTFAALGVLDEFRFRDGIKQAVRRAAARAGELGEDIASALLEKQRDSHK